MPYGIKNETPEITKKIDDCIAAIKDDKTPIEKIAICKAQVIKEMGGGEKEKEEDNNSNSDKDTKSFSEMAAEIKSFITEKIDSIKLSISEKNLSDYMPIMTVTTAKDFKFTESILKQIADNYNKANAFNGFEAPIILGHTSEGVDWLNKIKTNNIPAFAYVNDLKFDESDKKLKYRICKRTAKFNELVELGFDKVSAEIMLSHSNTAIPTPIIGAIAMLGANQPCISEAIIDPAKLNNDSSNTIVTMNLNELNSNKEEGEKVSEKTNEEINVKLAELEAKEKDIESRLAKLAELEEKTRIDNIEKTLSVLPPAIRIPIMKFAEIGIKSPITEIKLNETDEKPSTIEDLCSSITTSLVDKFNIKLENVKDSGNIPKEQADIEIGYNEWKDFPSAKDNK